MASRHEVLCIHKTDRPNPHERITHIGGRNDDGTAWKITQEEAIAGIESGKWTFYVRPGRAHSQRGRRRQPVEPQVHQDRG